MRYGQVHDGDLIRPNPQIGHRTRCCDCGLVHVMDFFVVQRDGKRVVLFRARRDNRATAAVRRRLRRRLLKKTKAVE